MRVKRTMEEHKPGVPVGVGSTVNESPNRDSLSKERMAGATGNAPFDPEGVYVR